jgi:hypothetical protein
MLIWIYELIPFWLIHLVVLSGLVGILVSYFISIIPFISKYKLPIRFISIAVLLLGIFSEGGIMYRAEMDKVRAEIARIEKESKQVTEKVVTKYIEKTKVIKETGDVIVKNVPVYVTKESDNACIIPNGFVSLHDSAAKNKIPNSTSGINDQASGIKLSEVTTTVVGNYNQYNSIKQQLESLQEWIRLQEKLYND